MRIILFLPLVFNVRNPLIIQYTLYNIQIHIPYKTHTHTLKLLPHNMDHVLSEGKTFVKFIIKNYFSFFEIINIFF